MSFFATDRERRLWLWTLAVVIAIYATLGMAGTLAEVLPRHLVDSGFFFGFLVLLLAITGLSLKKLPTWREIWVALGVAAVYAMAFTRLGIPERTHLFEYGLLGVLVYQALTERLRGGRRVPAPAVLAVLATAILGWIDEGIQSLLPNRVYDLVDVGFNAGAALISVLASLVLLWVRRKVAGE